MRIPRMKTRIAVTFGLGGVLEDASVHAYLMGVADARERIRRHVAEAYTFSAQAVAEIAVAWTVYQALVDFEAGRLSPAHMHAVGAVTVGFEPRRVPPGPATRLACLAIIETFRVRSVDAERRLLAMARASGVHALEHVIDAAERVLVERRKHE